MKKVLMLALLISSTGLFAQDGAQLYQQHCLSCHGQNGQGMEQTRSPKLQGQHDWYILSSIELFKKGERSHANSSALGVYRGLDQAQLAAIATYLKTAKNKAEENSNN